LQFGFSAGLNPAAGASTEREYLLLLALSQVSLLQQQVNPALIEKSSG